MMQNTEIAWINGEFSPVDEAFWPLADRGLSLGDGLFETLRIKNGSIRHFDHHWQRLQNSAKALDFGDIGSGHEISQVIIKLLQRNEIEQGSARILLSKGVASRGLSAPKNPNCNWLIRVFGPVNSPIKAIQLALSQVRRCISNPVSAHKTISHLDMVMSRNWLVDGARGNESLLLDVRGKLCCAGTANLFWLHGDSLFTPKMSCAILPGTTRARLLKIAPSFGLKVKTGAYWPKVLQNADGVFLSNALIGVRAVEQVDLGQGEIFSFETKLPIIAKLAASEA